MARLTRVLNNSILAALLAASWTSSAVGADTSVEGRVAYRHVTLIDGTGAPARPGMTVFVRGELIEAVTRDRDVTATQLAGAESVDLRGRFLLPGLIDAYQHLTFPPNHARAVRLLRRDIYSGITAMLDRGGDDRIIAELDREARVGEIAGPDLYYVAMFGGHSLFATKKARAATGGGWKPGTTPWAQAVGPDTDIKEAITKARGTGASGIEIYGDLPPELVRNLSAEARRQNLRVYAHAAVFPALPSDVIAAGPDTMEHTCYLTYQISSHPPQTHGEMRMKMHRVDPTPFAKGDNPVMAGLFREMRTKGIILDPTLRVFAQFEREAAAAGTQPWCTVDLNAALTAQARREGVMMTAGSDGDETPFSDPYPGLFEELDMLVAKAGFTPLEAIRSATQIGAMAIGEGNRMGVVAPGRIANLVVLKRDPVANIANMRSVVLTIKRGKWFDRSDFWEQGLDWK